jgi:hypothetical protein
MENRFAKTCLAASSLLVSSCNVLGNSTATFRAPIAADVGSTSVAAPASASSGIPSVPTSPVDATPSQSPSPIASPTASPTSKVSPSPSPSSIQTPSGATYYLSPAGSDSNNGLSAESPWLSPNHALNCGDTILAAPGSYSASNFQSGKWGTVSCTAGNNVAWLKCATFDACKISASTQGIYVDESYWGVQGWEVSTNTTTSGACFTAAPRFSNPVTIHHIIFANNVANGCMGSGFNQYDNSTKASADYVAIVGNIAFNAAQGSDACYSGIGIYQPIAVDTQAGTHMFIAGNFSYGNYDPPNCNGTASTDGEGIIIDTMDFSQGGGTPYTQQVYVKNNMTLGNGSFGLQVYNNQVGSAHAPVYFTNNTAYGNIRDTNQNKEGAGEITIIAALNTNASYNISETSSVSAPGGGHAVYGFALSGGGFSDTVASNWIDGVSGNNTFIYSSGSFAFGLNTMGTSPLFTNPVIPGAPACSGTANTVSCMAQTISDFTPTNAAAKSYGYQVPITTNVADPLFPQWLCNVNLPAGLVTRGCQ